MVREPVFEGVKMRILYCWSYYEPYLKSFYAANPGFSDMTYRDQSRLIKSDYFGVPGSYATWTERLGHNCELVITNCEPMQRRWAEENGVDFKDGWQRNIALEQVKRFQPDIFFMGSMFELYGNFLEEAKKYSRKTVGWVACPIPKGIPFGKMDMILSSSSLFVDIFREMGVRSEVLRPAFDPDILEMLPESEPHIPFSFIGGLSTDHLERYRLLCELSKRTLLELWGYGFKSHGVKARIKNFLHRTRVSANLIQRYHGEVWGLEMYRVLRRSKITFNSHIDVAGDLCGNMRMYEATGVGTLLLTDNKINLPELFVPGVEVVAYKNLDDAVEKVAFYLQNEPERMAIARAGQKRTLEHYSYQNNMFVMFGYFGTLLENGANN